MTDESIDIKLRHRKAHGGNDEAKAKMYDKDWRRIYDNKLAA
jgi:hypothetical protein